MPDSNSLEIMQELGRIHADIKQDLGEVKAEMAGFKGAFESDLRATNVRIDGVVKDLDDQKYWSNVKAASGPIMVVIHAALRKFGINI